MPRFYFEIGTERGAIPDYDGIELVSLDQVQLEADQSARELLAGAIISGEKPPIDVTVYDDDRQFVTQVLLRDLMPWKRDAF